MEMYNDEAGTDDGELQDPRRRRDEDSDQEKAKRAKWASARESRNYRGDHRDLLKLGEEREREREAEEERSCIVSP